MVTLDRKDLAKYPFLKESQAFISKEVSSLESYLTSPVGSLAVSEAVNLIEQALQAGSKIIPAPDIPPESSAQIIIIAVYPLSRLIVLSLIHI